jgi:phosphatidylserine decarboxylase
MASYAHREVTVITVIGGVLTIVCGATLGAWLLLPLAATLAALAFYRDPPRCVPDDAGVLLSPADGKIMSVEAEYRGVDSETAELRICIFLSVLNVHINRSPCAGRVREIRYQPGVFLNAMKPEATDKNENSLMVLDPAGVIPGPVRVRQISGALARRIVCEAEANDVMTAGQRFGMIKLGSQTEIRAPADSRWEVLVGAGETVRGGVTALARWNGDR